MAQIDFSDFYKVPNLKFDIGRLKNDLEVVLKKKSFFSMEKQIKSLLSHFRLILSTSLFQAAF